MTRFENFTVAEPLAWCRGLRDIPVSSMAKLVGHVLAMHIRYSDDGDKRRARVGVMRLAYETSTSKRTVSRALAELETAGLIFVHERGSNSGRQARASEYCLTTHDGLKAMRTDYQQWLAQHTAPDTRQRPEQVPA